MKKKEKQTMACLQVAREKATSLVHWKASYSFGVLKKINKLAEENTY